MVKFTCNEYRKYGIFTIVEMDEFDDYRAAYILFTKLEKAEECVKKEDWISADDVGKKLRLPD